MADALLIFDLDGTLADTARDLTAALNHAMRPFGYPEVSEQETSMMVGEGITNLIGKATGSSDPARIGAVRDRFISYYEAHLTDHTRAYPGVAETLARLGGFRKAVLSNKRTEMCVRLLARLGLDHYFDLIAGGGYSTMKKPSPEPALKIMSELGVSPERTVMIGDSQYDIEAARGAGVRVIAVTYGFRPREALAGADRVVDAFGDVLPVIMGWGFDRRGEARFGVPELFGAYVETMVRIADGMFPVKLLDFGEHGLRIKSPVPFDPGTEREFTVSAPRSLSRNITLRARIVHCHENPGGDFMAGAEITHIDDELWFRVFQNTLRFIAERSGDIY